MTCLLIIVYLKNGRKDPGVPLFKSKLESHCGNSFLIFEYECLFLGLLFVEIWNVACGEQQKTKKIHGKPWNTNKIRFNYRQQWKNMKNQVTKQKNHETMVAEWQPNETNEKSRNTMKTVTKHRQPKVFTENHGTPWILTIENYSEWRKTRKELSKSMKTRKIQGKPWKPVKHQ